jgi:peptidoglycan/xylan/chitin deacetylase (PgdA/CDA1 family)
MRIVSLLFHDVYRRDAAESGFVSPAADRYKLSAQAFDAHIESVRSVRSDDPLRLADSPAVDAVRTGTFSFVLTVDDGGCSYGSIVADRLEACGWRGHAFVTTDWIGRPGFLSAAEIRNLDARGHVIGSHSASHPTRFSACSKERMLDEWRRSRCVLEDVLGHEVRVASVPGGYFSLGVARRAAEAGLRVLFTSEPTTAVRIVDGCTVIGRFAIRSGCSPDLSGRLVAAPARARNAEWAGWNAKKLVKPLLGSAYSRVADWLIASHS